MERDDQLSEIKRLFKGDKNPVQSVRSLRDENSELKKELDLLLKEKTGNLKQVLKNELEELNGVNFLAKKVDLDGGGLKDLSFKLGNEIDNLFLLLASEQEGKALLSCFISKNLAEEKELHAGNIIRSLGKLINGGGGGQAFYATAGGKNPNGIPEALEEARKFVLA